MTLQKFADQNDYVAFSLKKIEEHKRILNTSEDPKERKTSLDNIYKYYYCVYGYIQATERYGHISFKNSRSLVHELEETIKIDGD